MKTTTTSFYKCFSQGGETPLPDAKRIDTITKSGSYPEIFIDSCVCLHIIKIVDYAKKATGVDINKVIALKEYLSQHPIRINPIFAFLELCSKGGQFDDKKMRDFKYRIDFFEQIDLKNFKKLKYDFARDYFILDPTPKKAIPLNLEFESIWLNTYCALLKIRSIAKKGLAKEKAEKNIECFLQWMINDLDIVRGAEYELALNIFGGNTQFRKMIGLDCKESDIKKRLTGTSWDIFHAKTCSNSVRLGQLLQKQIEPFFLTSDTNLYEIFKTFSLKLVKDGGDEFGTSFIFNSDSTFPHLNDSFIDKQNKQMTDIFIERRNKVYTFDMNNVAEMIRVLEIENQIETA